MRARSSGELDEILNSIDPETLCGDLGVDYRMTHGSSGAQINVHECPRCGGSDWKVFLNAESGLGNCFHGSCVGEPGFNKFSFASAFLEKSPKETAAYFKKYADTAVWRPKREAPAASRSSPDSDFQLPDSIEIAGSLAQSYLADRGFDLNCVDKFGWSYCEKGYFNYRDDSGESRGQPYAGRIIIPICDLDESIVTFQGRDITGSQEKKYIFPPGLPGSGRFLYNAQAVKGIENVVMGEGVFDVAAIDQAFAGISEVGAIGSFGKSLSGIVTLSQNDQLSRLLQLKKLGMRRLVMMWDGEKSAIVQACKIAQRIVSIGIDTYIAILPKDKDPNEVSKEVVRAAYVNSLRATRANITKITLRHCR